MRLAVPTPKHMETGRAWQTGIYIHIPFCEKKCPYCDFNTYAGLESLYDDTVDALCAELAQWAPHLSDRTIQTVFLGGGTPTALSVAHLEQLFETVTQHYQLSSSCEITSEVNPGAVDRDKFSALKSMGVNRLSMGVQSFQESELRFLGRIHGTEDVTRAYQAARDAGFENINLDFIFGLPEQHHQTWADTLHRALSLSPDHLSLYSLIVEPNTVLNHWVQTGKVPSPDDDAAAHHYEIAMDLMAKSGYDHYEVSNWSRTPEAACEHNLIYWRNDDYLGIGPGAHSHLRLQQSHSAGMEAVVPQLAHMAADSSTQQSQTDSAQPTEPVEFRWGNRKPVPGYVKRIRAHESTGEFYESPTNAEAMGETMMLGLRLIKEGISFERFSQYHHQDLRSVYSDEIEELLKLGHIQIDSQGIKLTPSGLMLGNQVFYRFL